MREKRERHVSGWHSSLDWLLTCIFGVAGHVALIGVLAVGVAASARAAERVDLKNPVSVTVRKTDGTRLKGQVVSYDAKGFRLKGESAIAFGASDAVAERVEWSDLTAKDVFAIHERLLAKATGQQWLEAGKVLLGLDGGKAFAETAFALAKELDPKLEKDIEKAKTDAAVAKARGRSDEPDEVNPFAPEDGAGPLKKVLKIPRPTHVRLAKPLTVDLPSQSLAHLIYLSKKIRRRLEAKRHRYTGELVSFNVHGFWLKTGKAKPRLVRWHLLDAKTVFKLHETLLKDGTAWQWFHLGRLLGRLRNGKPWSAAAFEMAGELDPRLMALDEFNFVQHRAHLKTLLGKRLAEVPTEPSASAKSLKSWYKCRIQYDAAKKNRKTLYHVIADHLLVADSLLASDEQKKRRLGLGIARQAALATMWRLKDKPVAVAICDLYLMPNLDEANPRHTEALSTESVVGTLAFVYRESNETGKWVEACRLRLRHAYNRNTADAARFRLAHALEAQGKYQEAIRHVRAVDQSDKHPNAQKMMRRLELKHRELVAKEKTTAAQEGGEQDAGK